MRACGVPILTRTAWGVVLGIECANGLLTWPHATCHQCAAVLGSQWGDEGKGKLSDVLAKKYAPATVRAARCRFLWLTHVCCSYDIVARFNGGTNAGHTVVANGQKFAFHILPCGLVYPHTVNLIGNGTSHRRTGARVLSPTRMRSPVQGASWMLRPCSRSLRHWPMPASTHRGA